MKNIMRMLLFCVLVGAASSAISREQQASGVYGVDVFVKQKPKMHAVTDANGNFSLEPLPPGSYTLAFRARHAKDLQSSTSDKVIVATLYSINIEGSKGSVTRNGLTSNKLLAGVDVPVELAAGANVRGHVRPAAKKEMVWVPNRTGSHMAGHWVEKGSDEASPHHIYELGPGNWMYR